MTAAPTPAAADRREFALTRDGAPFMIRPISREDKQALVAGFERLSTESRYRRFLATVKHLSRRDVAYLTEVDHRDHEALVAFAPNGEMIGVARYIRSPHRRPAAEVAITVADEWQGRGVGTALLRRLVCRARAAGIDVFVATCLAGNKEIVELLEELGPTARKSGGEDVTLEIQLGTGAEAAMRPALCPVASDDRSRAAS